MNRDILLEKMAMLDYCSYDKGWYVIVENEMTIFEIRWKADVPISQNKWRIREKGNLFWTVFKKDESFINELIQLEIDLYKFENKLSSFILNQTAFAQTIVDRVGNYFGHEEIQRVIKENKSFKEDLQKLVSSLLSSNDKIEEKPRTLTIIK